VTVGTILAILAAAVCGGLVVVGGFLLFGSRRSRESGVTSDALSQLTGQLAGRLDQLTQSQMAAQAKADERQQVQERLITKMIDERLGTVTHRLNETLDRNTKSQKTVLDSLTERLTKIDVAQKNLDQLSDQVVGLQDILGNKQARGAFGEVQLQNLVSAVLPAASYELQATLGNGKRADCLLQLPNPPGPIAIDAKFPLESYRAMQTHLADPKSTELKDAQRRFAADVSKHIKDIADRYIIHGETADAALMFLPSEAVYAELHANFPQVIERSFRARVFIVSPTTLWATLNTVRAVLRDVHMKEAASVIQAEVMKMLDDVSRLGERVTKLQRHHDQASDDMRQIQISTDKVTRRGESIQELQIEGAEGRLETSDDTQSQIVPGPGRLRSISD